VKHKEIKVDMFNVYQHTSTWWMCLCCSLACA